MQNKNSEKESMQNENEKLPVLVSACLLGVSCKYSGGHNYSEAVADLKEKYQLIPVCPEQMGGLMTPRVPAEVCSVKRRQMEKAGMSTVAAETDLAAAEKGCIERRVVAKNGTDVTEQFQRGAQEALKLAKLFGCKCAVLKSRSPSCGSGIIYDGTFTGTKVAGDGITAALLKENGIEVFSEEELHLFRKE